MKILDRLQDDYNLIKLTHNTALHEKIAKKAAQIAISGIDLETCIGMAIYFYGSTCPVRYMGEFIEVKDLTYEQLCASRMYLEELSQYSEEVTRALLIIIREEIYTRETIL